MHDTEKRLPMTVDDRKTLAYYEYIYIEKCIIFSLVSWYKLCVCSGVSVALVADVCLVNSELLVANVISSATMAHGRLRHLWIDVEC